MKIQAKSKIKKGAAKRTKAKNPFKVRWNGIPATIKPALFETSLQDSVVVSLFWHFMTMFIASVIIFCVVFFGLTPKLFPQPQTKIKDIEFALKSKYGYRAFRSKSRSAQAPKNNKTPTFQNKQTVNKVSAKNKNEIRNSQEATSDFTIPVPNLNSLTSGLGTSKRGRAHSSGDNSGSLSEQAGAFSSGESSLSASGFDKNAARKIITVYDISPYVNELKREIRWNWKMPPGSENKRVELFLRIARDGKVIILNVKRTSETGEIDEAALNAVRKCFPLNPLPSKYGKNYLDVIFTFSSNYVGSKY